MATKTIAVDSNVYARLASTRREGESFSRAIDRLLDEVASSHTGADILSAIDQLPGLSETDAEDFLSVIEEARSSESWEPA